MNTAIIITMKKSTMSMNMMKMFITFMSIKIYNDAIIKAVKHMMGSENTFYEARINQMYANRGYVPGNDLF